ncbi:glycosyltransferase family 2 protein [Patescibacteria group bacterium]|nr:glycosyltransferase family 2 protein [Patescibacteria group bacterium]MBU1673550.1 glycosyltransferase family 2 protein [Patescibacteria group bacterium]MBU1963628.1 glycosyltransferase family 2 protein [Patescibacteria group bacterium]
MNWFEIINSTLQIVILIYFLQINLLYTFFTVLAFFEVRRQGKRIFIDDYAYLYHSKLTPGVSLLVPAYNEEATIVDSLKSHLRNKYPKYEVICINDGSTDKTLEILKKEFKLKEKKNHVIRTDVLNKPIRGYYVSTIDSSLIVIDKEGGGKSDALNAGINVARYPYFMSLDADTMLEEDAILKIMKPMVENPKNVASGGIVRVINGCTEKDGIVSEIKLSKNSLVRFQVLEYIRAFTAGRAGFSRIKNLLIVSGAFGVFKKDEVIELGGYKLGNIGEDMEVLVNLHEESRKAKRDYNILYRAYPVAWTEVPENLKSLGRQRNRWHRGLAGVLWSYKHMLFNPKYGSVGMFGLPFFFLFEFLGPIIEFTGYLYLIVLIAAGIINWPFFFLFLALAILWGVFLSISALLFEELNFKWYKKWYYIIILLIYAVIENVSYRQITVWYRIKGLLSFARGEKAWGKQERKGFKNGDS